MDAEWPIGKWMTFTAVVGKVKGDKRLLFDVYWGDCLFRDHIWMNGLKKFKYFEEGDVIVFEAKINRYWTTGVKYKPKDKHVCDIQPTILNYEITNLRNITRIES